MELLEQRPRFASRGSGVRIPPRPPILSDCNALTRFTFAPITQIWLQLCTNAVIAVRLCTLVPPTERQGPPVLFRWLYGLAFPEVRVSSATSFANIS